MEYLPSIRASDADREQVAERLRHATLEGRLTGDELEQRLEALYATRTYGDLDALVADLPVARSQSQPRLRIRRLLLAVSAATLVLGVLGMVALSRVHTAVGVVGGGRFRGLTLSRPIAALHHEVVLAASTGVVLLVLLAGAGLFWAYIRSRPTHGH